MRLSRAIDEANRARRMGLVLYTIPNFPDPGSSRAILDDLCRRPAVSIVETTFAVDDSFSDHANETIRDAHRIASRHESDYRGILSMFPIEKPSLCVLYQRTGHEHTFERVARDMSGRIDGVLLEWNEPEIERYHEAATRAGVELVQCIGPWMPAAELEHLLGFCSRSALLYLMSAPKTGAPLFRREELEETIAIARRLRADIKVAAGFGVRTAADVRELARVEGLDAVIIGTAFLEAARCGPAAASAYLDGIEGALWR
ncbi:tryptophan synthase subunit alpha [Sorangium sp. So ce1014]|uniref:tryptophan synthase subunit alpha n=1 Tax=Sorangium sp. So ce1014 TaxID=3133326 RepID=UPI003F5DFCED